MKLDNKMREGTTVSASQGKPDYLHPGRYISDLTGTPLVCIYASNPRLVLKRARSSKTTYCTTKPGGGVFS